MHACKKQNAILTLDSGEAVSGTVRNTVPGLEGCIIRSQDMIKATRVTDSETGEAATVLRLLASSHSPRAESNLQQLPSDE